jgi:hypothetical protein
MVFDEHIENVIPLLEALACRICPIILETRSGGLGIWSLFGLAQRLHGHMQVSVHV